MKNFKYRRAKTWTSFWKLKKMWDSIADIKLKIKLFIASVLSVLLYATETYVIDAALQNKTNAFQTKFLRIILNISRDNHVRNDYIYKQTNTKPLMQRVTKNSGETRTTSSSSTVFMYQHTDGRRRSGQQKTTYQQYIAKTIYGMHRLKRK